MIGVEEIEAFPLFEGLTEDQLGDLVAGAGAAAYETGALLFREGDPADFWWVLVSGAVELSRHAGREDVVVGRMEPGRWAGGFRAWDEHGVYLATAHAAVPARLLRVPAQVLRELLDAWFPFGRHMVEGLYRTARSIEATARQRESLVALGTLAAGLAHEINNPAAASIRAVEALGESSDALLSSVGWLADVGLSAPQFAALERLRRQLAPTAEAEDLLALSDREAAVSSWLESRQLADAWDLGPTLAAAGADPQWCEEVESVLGGSGVEPAIRWVAATVTITALLGELGESTRRISDLVTAVRSYSQLDRAALQTVDLVEGLESTLVMLGHKLRPGVLVVRDYADGLPAIEAYPGELNQVWTNVIDNAVDAMGGTGTLRVSTRADDAHLVVEIGDTGPGMSPDVAGRAFDAFFTTKEVGKGTGLGLDIARRIVVERHRGEIEIERQGSDPGETVLRVRLPIRSGAGSG